MAVQRFAPTNSATDIATALAEDGCAIVERVVSPEVMDAIRSELAPFLAATPYGPDDFSGRRTRRTGGLIARSPASRELISHPLVLEIVGTVLAQATSFQLHLTQLITIGPDEPAQLIHRDQWAFDFFPFPLGYEVQCNTIWAMTEFSEANGATRLVPGSHRLGERLQFNYDETEAAEMPVGSVLLYTGALYHGAGANRSPDTRCGINITYAVSWLRQEENQYLSVPVEIAKQLPDSLLRLMGYARGAYALGYVDDMRDPLDVLRGTTTVGFGDLSDAASRAGRRAQDS